MKNRIIRWFLKKLNYELPNTTSTYIDRQQYDIVPVKKTVTGNKQGFPLVGRADMTLELVRFLIDENLVTFKTTELPITHHKENMQLTAEILVLRKKL